MSEHTSDIADTTIAPSGDSSLAGYAGLLSALFFVGLLPFAYDYIVHFPDERHYTDGALQMLESGDFFSPKTADGSHRFRKPVLAYWLVAASFQCFGITPFTARLPFLIVGAAIIVFVMKTALLLYGNQRVARMAGLIMFCHPQLIFAATRSMPDALICLSLTISIYGFIAVFVKEQPRDRDYYAAYAGVALGVLSKGLPAIVFLFVAWAFVAIVARGTFPLRRLWHGKSMLAGAIAAASWYVIIFYQHGFGAVDGFLDDQVNNRVSWNLWDFPLQVGESIGFMFLNFLPWSFGLVVYLVSPRTTAGAPSKSVQLARQFLAAWILTVTAMMGLVAVNSERYLLLASPALAIWMAPLLLNGDTVVADGWNRAMRRGFVVFALLAGLFAFSVNEQLGHIKTGAIMLSAFTGYALITAMATRRRSRLAPEVSLAVGLFLLIPLLTFSLRHIVLPDQSKQIAENMELLNLAEARYVGKPAMPAKIRVQSEGRTQIDLAKASSISRQDGERRALIVNTQFVSTHSLKDYEVLPISTGISDIYFPKFLSALFRRQLVQFFDEGQEVHVLCVPKRDRVARLSEGESSSHARWR